MHIEKLKSTIRVSKKCLMKLLTENIFSQRQITELQTRNTELVMQNRDLKYKISLLEDKS